MTHTADFRKVNASFVDTPISALQAAYRQAIEDVNSRLILPEGELGSEWNKLVRNVIVVLSASRSGSSLIYNALCSTGEIVAPAGEHEPWITLSENKYPFKQSDAISDDIDNQPKLLRLMRNDLLVRSKRESAESTLPHLSNRLIIRRSEGDANAAVLDDIRAQEEVGLEYWERVIAELGGTALKPMPVEVSQFTDPEFSLPIENPPLIDQPLSHIASDDELSVKTLLFKSPSDVYRSGMYEQLFPNATIRYIHLSRGFVQTTNGLMDGWQKDDTDFISNPVGIPNPLNIQDYSITDLTKSYWCFDLFPGWEKHTDSTLLEVCADQWLNAHIHALENFDSSGRVSFEQFYTDPAKFYALLSDLTDIDTTDYNWSKNIMSTETPSQYRWKKRETTFRNLSRYLPGEALSRIREVQDELGYSMQEETWT
jgi:hypothetical protein